MLNRENNRCFVFSRRRRYLFGENEKTGEIIRIVFNPCCQNLQTVDFSRPGAGNRGSVFNSLFFYHFYASGSVVGGYLFAMQVFQVCPTLTEGLGMRIDFFYGIQTDSWMGYQAMHHAQFRLSTYIQG